MTASSTYKSPLKENCENFIDDFESQWKKLNRGFGKDKVFSPSFFIGKSGDKGFITHLSECFRYLGLIELSEKCDQLYQNNESKIKLKDFFAILLKFREDQLITLSTLHQKIVQVDVVRLPDKIFRGIISFYDRQSSKHNHDRLEAGDLIMRLSEMAHKIVNLKQVFQSYKPITLNQIDKILDSYETDKHRKSDELNDAYDSIMALQDSLHTSHSPLADLTLWNIILGRQQRDILKCMLIAIVHNLKETHGEIQESLYGLRAWLEWKKLCKYDKTTELIEKTTNFTSVVDKVEDKTDVYLLKLFNLLKSIEKILSEGYCGISLYFRDLISDIYNLVDDSVGNELLKAESKQTFKNIRLKAQSISSKVNRHIKSEVTEIKKMPHEFHRRFIYLSHEIPRVISRGNINEVKKMALILDIHYKLINIVLSRQKFDSLSKHSKEQIRKSIKHKSGLIIHNSKKLLQLHTA